MFGFGKKATGSSSLGQDDLVRAEHGGGSDGVAPTDEAPRAQETDFSVEVLNLTEDDSVLAAPEEMADNAHESAGAIDVGEVELASSDIEETEEAIYQERVQNTLKNAELHVGPGITLKGDVTTCESLIVQGNLNGTIDAAQLQILSGGAVDGTATVQSAEVEGSFTGTLSVKGLLTVRGAGKIEGTIRYGELEVERGCHVSGDVAQSDVPSEPDRSENRRFMRSANPAGVKAA